MLSQRQLSPQPALRRWQHKLRGTARLWRAPSDDHRLAVLASVPASEAEPG
jgi:hypothetical protein